MICPGCGSNDIETTLRGCLAPPDTNRATCLDCGWKGIAQDAIDAAAHLEPFRVTDELGIMDLGLYGESPSPNLWVHSTGGNAFSFFGLNYFADQRQARVHIAGLAGGGAALLTARKDVVIHPLGTIHFLEHRLTASEPALGNRARDCEQLDHDFSVAVAKHAKVYADQVRAWMAQGRWLTADESLAAGLVNAISETPQWETA